MNHPHHKLVETLIRFQELFPVPLRVVGSAADVFLFCLPEDKIKDLDFAYGAENHHIVQKTVDTLGDTWKFYGGKFCGKKFSGIWEGYRVDIFLDYPFTNPTNVVYNGIMYQCSSARWKMLQMLLTCPKSEPWFEAKKKKISDLINSEEFRL